MIETETPAERRLRALADDGRSGAGDFQQIDEAHGRACDMGREALALLRRAILIVDCLSDDDADMLEAEARALLARAGEVQP